MTWNCFSKGYAPMNPNSVEYTAWLRSLKTGDKVMLKTLRGDVLIVVVESVTKSGRIRSGNREFNPDGRQRGESSHRLFPSPVGHSEIWEHFRNSSIMESALKKVKGNYAQQPG